MMATTKEDKLKRLRWLKLQLIAKSGHLKDLCSLYPNASSMSALLRVASHSLDEPPSQNNALELAKEIKLLERQIGELERELEKAA
jgi:hypothetical protein